MGCGARSSPCSPCDDASQFLIFFDVGLVCVVCDVPLSPRAEFGWVFVKNTREICLNFVLPTLEIVSSLLILLCFFSYHSVVGDSCGG